MMGGFFKGLFGKEAALEYAIAAVLQGPGRDHADQIN
jgi:hypothetical protein